MIRSLADLAQVAKLVDALASGASGGDSVEVQVLSWAPQLYIKIFLPNTWENKSLKSYDILDTSLDTFGVLGLVWTDGRAFGIHPEKQLVNGELLTSFSVSRCN